jgi:hypothetical protein
MPPPPLFDPLLLDPALPPPAFTTVFAGPPPPPQAANAQASALSEIYLAIDWIFTNAPHVTKSQGVLLNRQALRSIQRLT